VYPLVSPIQPISIPVIILFGGGVGGGADGVLRTGKYDVRIVFEYDTIAVRAHRLRFPNIPVCQYTLGGDLNDFLSTLDTYVKRSEWKQCLLQASPPCRKLSSSNKRRMHRDEMMQLVDWTFSAINLIGPAVYIVENVKQMNENLTPYDKTNRYHTVFDLQYYIPQRRERAIVSNIPLRNFITPLSLVPIPASSVLPLEPSHMHIMNRYKYSTSINQPSLTIVGHAMYMYDPRTDTRTVMPIKHAQVLQGFTYSLEVDRYFTSVKRMRLAIGDAIPPSFMYAVGIAVYKYMNRHRQLSLQYIRDFEPIGARHVIWPREYSFVDDITDTYTDLCDVVLLCTDDSWQLITCTLGTTDSNKYQITGVNRLVGECMMLIDGIIDHTSLDTGMRAISTGRCDYIVVRNAYPERTVPPCMMSVYTIICKASVKWGVYRTRMKIFGLLRSYSYAQIHDLYRTAEYIVDAKVRARCRTTLTKYTKFRFKVHPAPVFSISVPSCFGMRRSILTKIVWQILCKCHIPYEAKRRLNSDIKYSFTTNPPVGEILCNSRRWIKKWNINHVWPCTCQTICSRLGITKSSHNTAEIDGNQHIHTFIDQQPRCLE
jgi:site-specific DNA-cytosine methylase